MKYSRISVIISLFAVLLFAGCAKQEMADNREHDYGYVQFKLYKEASYVDTKAIVPQLQYLSDATKIMVMLQFGNDEITQTLTLSASNSGLRSSVSEARSFSLLPENITSRPLPFMTSLTRNSIWVVSLALLQ